MVTLVIRQVHLKQVQVGVNVLHQTQALDHQMHGAHAATVERPGSLGHLVVDVTGLEHGAGLVFPVLGLQAALDSLLAIP